MSVRLGQGRLWTGWTVLYYDLGDGLGEMRRAKGMAQDLVSTVHFVQGL
jgi:hypothetical protein